MGLDLQYIEGQTPLDEDEKDGLLLKTISTRGELDEFEQQNIEQAMLWLKRRKPGKDEILTEAFIRDLHRRMFGHVWKWAGEFRKTNKNIGVDKYQIGTALRSLLDDCRFWIANQTFSEDETAIRFKHGIVRIHCFANGNGRHSRLMADVLVYELFGLNYFTWGNGNLTRVGDSRKQYLTALREADGGNFDPLIAFARS